VTTATRSAEQVPQGLEVHDLSISYGGHKAVSNFGLHAPPGHITGLIGPNGAGKTTIFNACSGLVRPSSGRLSLFGKDITDASCAARARSGLGRTFQKVEVCNAMTVRANVALGLEARLAGSNPVRQLFSTGARKRTVTVATDQALELCDLHALADRRVSTLSTGQRRLLELARVVAGGFRLLLLDEPSSGLDVEETRWFSAKLQQVVAERGVGILLVEHDMELVMSICSYLFVLDFGHLIFEGTPAQTQAAPEVRRAYLGEES
jgi:ABC-type branched-subunit amino acid transport system ATPase component